MNLHNISNEYADALGILFDHTPKAVFAAIAVSLATNGGEQLRDADDLIIAEWACLHENGIVPQKPHKPMTERHELPSSEAAPAKARRKRGKT